MGSGPHTLHHKYTLCVPVNSAHSTTQSNEHTHTHAPPKHEDREKNENKHTSLVQRNRTHSHGNTYSLCMCEWERTKRKCSQRSDFGFNLNEKYTTSDISNKTESQVNWLSYWIMRFVSARLWLVKMNSCARVCSLAEERVLLLHEVFTHCVVVRLTIALKITRASHINFSSKRREICVYITLISWMSV